MIMIKHFSLLISFFLLPELHAQNHLVEPCSEVAVLTHSRAGKEEIKAALNELTKLQVPGAVAAIYDAEGWWTYATGYARIEDNRPMEICHLQYLQSVAKTYMAVGIMKLYEEGRIKLDAPVTDYLSQSVSRAISGADRISIRMLLNHTSGIAEYNYHPAYITKLLQQSDRVFQPEEYLAYVKGQQLDFEPGSRYAYRNINYVLLALIADQITGDHVQWLRQVIFEPLDLQNTFYRIAPDEHFGGRLVDSYWDRHSDGLLENVSTLQQTNVASMVGDDGIICTPKDAVLFLRGLMEGKLLRETSLQMMMQWVNNDQGKPAYGLGLSRIEINGEIGIGHSGGGIGSGCQLYYFPEKGIFLFMAINLGTVTDSPIHKNAEATLAKLYNAILE